MNHLSIKGIQKGTFSFKNGIPGVLVNQWSQRYINYVMLCKRVSLPVEKLLSTPLSPGNSYHSQIFAWATIVNSLSHFNYLFRGNIPSHIFIFLQGLTGADGHQQRTDYVLSANATPGRYCTKKKVRSLRCHDDYGNENVKKAIDFEQLSNNFAPHFLLQESSHMYDKVSKLG